MGPGRMGRSEPASSGLAAAHPRGSLGVWLQSGWTVPARCHCVRTPWLTAAPPGPPAAFSLIPWWGRQETVSPSLGRRALSSLLRTSRPLGLSDTPRDLMGDPDTLPHKPRRRATCLRAHDESEATKSNVFEAITHDASPLQLTLVHPETLPPEFFLFLTPSCSTSSSSGHKHLPTDPPTQCQAGPSGWTGRASQLGDLVSAKARPPRAPGRCSGLGWAGRSWWSHAFPCEF